MKKKTSSLPLPPPLFRGRAVELARLVRHLQGGRGVAICGLGGMGKTSLALAAAGNLCDGFTRQAYTQVRAGDGVSSVVARLLPLLADGVVEQRRDEEAAGHALAEALASSRALVVLDDVHHLPVRELRALLRRVLPFAADSRLLVTSRRNLTGLDGELAVLLLGPLSKTESRALYRELSGGREVPRGVDGGIPIEVRQLAAGAATRSPLASLLDQLDPEDRLLLERLALCGPQITPADLGGSEASVERLREHCLLEPSRGAVLLHDTVREALAKRSDTELRQREVVRLLAPSREAHCQEQRLALAVQLGEEGLALEALRQLVDRVGFLRLGRAGIPGLEDRRLLDAVPRTRAALASFEILAIAGGTPEWVTALAMAPPGRTPEDDVLALVLGYGERAAEVDRRLRSAPSFFAPEIGLLAVAMYLAQQTDHGAAAALAACRAALDPRRPALAADLLTRIAWAEAFSDRPGACATLQEALPLARKADDFAALMDLVTDLSLSMLALGELEATRATLAREMPAWRHALLEDPLALAMLLHASVLGAQGKVPEELSLLTAMTDAPVLTPLTRYHAAGRVAQLLWLGGGYDAAGLLLDRALTLDVDRRATAALSVVDALIPLGRFSEAFERVAAITPTRETFRAVREAQLAFYGSDLEQARRSLAKATRTFAATRAAVEGLECRLLLAEGKREQAAANAGKLLEWATREKARPGELDAHALLAACDQDRSVHLGALKSMAGATTRAKGGLADRARGFLAVLGIVSSNEEPWLQALRSGKLPEPGPFLPICIDALGLTGRAPSLQEVLVGGVRETRARSENPSTGLIFDCASRTLTLDGQAHDLSAQARPCRVLEVLALASPEWVTTADLFTQVFELPFKATRVNALHAVVKRLREILGPKSDVIVSARGKYRFDGADACVIFAPKR